MLASVISIILIIVCLAIIFILIARKFSVLASVDVDSIPEEKAAETKDRIIRERMDRKLDSAKKFIHLLLDPAKVFFKKIVRFFRDIYHKLIHIREKHKKSEIVGGSKVSEIEPDISLEQKIKDLIEDAQDLLKNEKYEQAEKKFIDVIALDKKQIICYKGLAEIYMAQKEWRQARDILKYAYKLQVDFIKLNPDAAGPLTQSLAFILNDLSEISFNLEQKNDALAYIKKALELDPNNPKFINALIDIYIKLGEKLRAERALELLKKANPENQKIIEIEELIKELSY